LLFISCGTRKVYKSNTETTTKTEVSIQDTTKIVTNVAYNIEKVVDNFEIVPIDTCKAIVIIDNNGKKTSYLNARIRHTHEKSINKTLKNEILQSSHKKNIKANTHIKTSVKQIERKPSLITQLWWLWLLLLVMLLYYLYTKLKPL
jgi:hypothetical protein